MIKDWKIHMYVENVVSGVFDMLKEIVRVQIDDDFDTVEKYVNDYFVWTDEIQVIGDMLQKDNKELN